MAIRLNNTVLGCQVAHGRRVVVFLLCIAIIAFPLYSFVRHHRKRALTSQVTSELRGVFLNYLLNRFDEQKPQRPNTPFWTLECIETNCLHTSTPEDRLVSWRYEGISQTSQWNAFGDLSDKPDFGLPWNSKTNIQYAGMPLYWPSSILRRSPSNLASCMLVTGPLTLFDENAREFDPQSVPNDLVIAMLVLQSRIHWMEPGDIDIRESFWKNELVTVIDQNPVFGEFKGIVVLFWDQTSWVLSPNTPLNIIEPFLTISGAREADRDLLLKPYQFK